jgi:hypothetical protein
MEFSLIENLDVIFRNRVQYEVQNFGVIII